MLRFWLTFRATRNYMPNRSDVGLGQVWILCGRTRAAKFESARGWHCYQRLKNGRAEIQRLEGIAFKDEWEGKWKCRWLAGAEVFPALTQHPSQARFMWPVLNRSSPPYRCLHLCTMHNQPDPPFYTSWLTLLKLVKFDHIRFIAFY